MVSINSHAWCLDEVSLKTWVKDLGVGESQEGEVRGQGEWNSWGGKLHTIGCKWSCCLAKGGLILPGPPEKQRYSLPEKFIQLMEGGVFLSLIPLLLLKSLCLEYNTVTYRMSIGLRYLVSASGSIMPLVVGTFSPVSFYFLFSLLLTGCLLGKTHTY